jgi:hypothetical protein
MLSTSAWSQDILYLPQSTMMSDNHVDGASFFRIKFDGTSKRTYGTKKMNSAMLYRTEFGPSMWRSLVRPWIFALPASLLVVPCRFTLQGHTNVRSVEECEQEDDKQRR